MSHNNWSFSGRVGADAELKTTSSGEKFLSFRVANDIGWGDNKTVQWVDVTFWGKRAESISSYVRKGDLVIVAGTVKLEEFQRRDGTHGSKLAVRANDVELDSSKRDGGSQGDARGESRSGYSNDRGGNNRGGGGGRDYGTTDSRGGAGGRGGGKPAFDQDLEDEIPFVWN